MIVKAINHLIVLLHSKWEAGFQCWILDHGGLTYRNILVSIPYNPKDETVAVRIRSSDLLRFREDNASTLTLVIAGLVCSRARSPRPGDCFLTAGYGTPMCLKPSGKTTASTWSTKELLWTNWMPKNKLLLWARWIHSDVDELWSWCNTGGQCIYIYIYIVLGDVLLTVCGSTVSGGDVCGCVAP